MAPTTEKSRQGTEMNISTEVQKTYESQPMTLKEATERDNARGKLKKLSVKYTEDSIKIQKELDDADAPQEFYDREAEAVRQTEEEINAAKVILKIKVGGNKRKRKTR